jgi:hypothetical protein
VKEFRSIMVLKCPREKLWNTMRDHLPQLAGRIDEIESVTELEREANPDGSVRIVNRWLIRQQVPVFARALVGATEVSWIDRNLWSAAKSSCEWTIEPSVMRDSLSCAGITRFEEAIGGRGTRVTFEGAIDLKPSLWIGPLASLQSPITRFLESIVTTVIPRNFRDVLDAAAAFATQPERCDGTPVADLR